MLPASNVLKINMQTAYTAEIAAARKSAVNKQLADAFMNKPAKMDITAESMGFKKKFEILILNLVFLYSQIKFMLEVKTLLKNIIYKKALIPYIGTSVIISDMRMTEFKILNFKEAICKSRAERVPAIILSVYINGIARESVRKKYPTYSCLYKILAISYAQTKNTEEISIEETSVICTVSEIVFFIESNPPFSFIDDISGSKRVDTALRKEAGKNMIGIVIPLIIPKRETERLLFNVCIKIASGTIRFSIV